MENIKELSAKLTDTLGGLKTKLDKFVSEDEAFWMATAMFLFGVIVGMILSPRRNLTIGSNNNAYNYEYGKEDEELEDKECCCS